MTTDEIGDGDVMDRDSSGWKHIYARFKEINDSNLQIKRKTAVARIGFDLGSGIGQSAYALSKLCPALEKLHCVDDKKQLQDPFKNAMGLITVEHDQTIQTFVAGVAGKPEQRADVVMISSMKGNSFFKTEDLSNLALSIKAGGILFEYNSDFPLSDSETPITDFFIPLYESRPVNAWQRK